MANIPGRQTNRSAANFLKTYFTFSYYLGLVHYKYIKPFKHETGIRTHGHLANKVFCAITHVLMTLYYIGQFRTAIVTSETYETALTFAFDLMFRLLSIAYYSWYFYMLWIKMEATRILLERFENINSDEPIPRDYRRCTGRTKISLATMLCLIYLFVGVASWIYRIKENPFTDWDFVYLIQVNAEKFKFLFLLEGDADHAIESGGNITILNGVCAGIHIFIRFYSSLAGGYSDLLIITFVLSFRQVVINFFEEQSQNIGQNDTTATPIWKKIKAYEFSKKIAKEINSILGFLYTVCLCASLPYFIVVVGNIAYNEEILFWRLHKVFFGVTTGLVLVLSADAVRKVRHLHLTLQGNAVIGNISDIDFIVISDDLSNNPTGLRGKGLPVITYGYVGSIFAIFLSYSILNLQMAVHCADRHFVGM